MTPLATRASLWNRWWNGLHSSASVRGRAESPGSIAVSHGRAEVLAHLAEGGAADLDRRCDVERVRPHQDDVGGLDRDVGAGADREADIGLCERRRVVDAVADHCDTAPLLLKLLHLLRLVL